MLGMDIFITRDLSKNVIPIQKELVLPLMQLGTKTLGNSRKWYQNTENKLVNDFTIFMK